VESAAKFGHAAVFPNVTGYEKEDGTRNYPCPCLVANLAKPIDGAPALITHSCTSLLGRFPGSQGVKCR
jgi:Zn-dependent oligopeptidase